MKFDETIFDSPSRLLEIALVDLVKTEQTPGYCVDMGRWLHNKDNVCHACLAGSFIRWSLGITYAPFAALNDGLRYGLNPGLKQYPIMCSLDNLRCGLIVSALREHIIWNYLVPFIKPEEEKMTVVSYHNDRKRWFKSMQEVLKILRKIESRYQAFLPTVVTVTEAPSFQKPVLV